MPDYLYRVVIVANNFLFLRQQHEFEVCCSHHGLNIEFEQPIFLATVIPMPIFELHADLYGQASWQQLAGIALYQGALRIFRNQVRVDVPPGFSERKKRCTALWSHPG